MAYEYDSLNQLTAEHHSPPCLKGGAEGEAEAGGYSYDTIEYTYDTRGNILSKTYLLGETTVDTIRYGYTDPAWKDRLTVYNNVGLNFDTIGNPTTWHDGSVMSWQRGRQLASYTNNDTTTSFTYNDDRVHNFSTCKKAPTCGRGFRIITYYIFGICRWDWILAMLCSCSSAFSANVSHWLTVSATCSIQCLASDGLIPAVRATANRSSVVILSAFPLMSI